MKTTDVEKKRGRPQSSSRVRSGSKHEGTAVGHGLTRRSKKSEGTLMDLFEEELKDILWVEKQLTKAIPKMIKAADSQELKEALENHLSETEEQESRLEQVFEKCNIKLQAKKCEAMEGLLEESSELMEEYSQGPLRDAGMIIGAQKIEHYEIAAYGSLCTLADLLNLDEVKDLLGSNLEEEKNADETLTEVARTINVQANENSEESDVETENSKDDENFLM